VPTPTQGIDHPACLEKSAHRSGVAPREHHLGRHTDLVDDGSQVAGRSEIEGDRLLEEQGLAGLRTHDGHRRLDVRRNGEGEGVDVVEHLLEVSETRGVVAEG